MEKVVVWGMPPLWGLPSPSPFCLKLETWLRIAEIPYEAKAVAGPIASPKGKIPYIERPDGSLLGDSAIIIDTLSRERAVDPDAGLTDEQRAQAVLVRRTLENHLYFAVAWARWKDDAGWRITGPGYFGTLPPVLRQIVPPLIRRKVLQQLHGQGMGRHSADEAARMGAEDLRAIAALLGAREHFFGRPTNIDAVVYGFLENLLRAPFDGPLREALLAQPNLVAYCDGMRARFWPEYAEPARLQSTA